MHILQPNRRSPAVPFLFAAAVTAGAGFGAGCSGPSTSAATASEGSSGDGSDTNSGCSGVLLTVKDVPISSPRCLISVAGGTAVGAGVRTICVPTGVTTLAATPLSKFTLAPRGTWHETDGDTGMGDKGATDKDTSTTTLTANTPGTKCVWACCPANGGGACPTTSQCP